MRYVTAFVLSAVFAAVIFDGCDSRASKAATVRGSVEGYIVNYAKRQADRRGWRGYEWAALNTIVMRESSWNPCRHYPSTTDCGYAGSNACGIPQRDPCPYAWRGRLWSTWKAQVRELMRYIADRYGRPSRALYVWNLNKSY